MTKPKPKPKSKPKPRSKPTAKRTPTPTGETLLWSIIERVRAKAKGELSASCDAFRAELEALSDRDLRAAEASFSAAMQRAYDYRLWHAAYIIHGGCGDDAFWDFRAGLVALGRKAYEAALKNPDSLAAVADLENLTLFEGFQYVPGNLLEARGLTTAGKGHSEGKPTGTRFGEGADVHRAAFPKLTAKFW